jgi:pyruvate,water dikinase
MTHDSAEAIHDPLMEQSPASVFWTTVNTAEGRPGVSTPFSQSVWGEAAERGIKGAFAAFGVLKASEVRYEDPAGNTTAIFYGRLAANVDTLRRLMDRTPGQSGEAFEKQLMGASRSGIERGESGWSRLPVVLCRLPLLLFRYPAMMRRAAVEQDRWWRECVRPEMVDEPSSAPERLRTAVRRFEWAMDLQCQGTFLTTGFYNQLSALCERIGLPGLERQLVGGYGDIRETRLVDDMWEAAHGRFEQEAIIRDWGYHGPREGELMSRVWREEPEVLARAIAAYGARGDDQAPGIRAARRAAEREAAERRLLARTGRLDRVAATLLLKLVRIYLPQREVGKAMYLQALDVARAVARATGKDWHRRGHLGEIDDAFFLTTDEICAPPSADVRARVDFRRGRYREYLRVRLPETWTGMPEPIPVESDAAAETPACLSGVAVCDGVVEGRARVITDAATELVEDGEILVCATTDPSWVPQFVLAAAVVVDIGGPLSHGAMVNTQRAMRVLRTGDLVRVDGAAGTVELLARPGG